MVQEAMKSTDGGRLRKLLLYSRSGAVALDRALG